MGIAHAARKSLAVCFLTCGLMICAHAQTSRLTFQSGRATVKNVIRPLKKSDAHFYYPDKREGEEPSIDGFSPDHLTQSGDYLFVISPAPSPGKYSVKFKVTN